MNRKHSRQRDSIKNILMSRTDHPTADTIYTCVREEYPNISLGTVYRNLMLLTELGEINKISTGDGADHYDANTRRHHHFICTRCQRIQDIWADELDAAIEQASGQVPGEVEFYRINFYGVCSSCKEEPVRTPHPDAQAGS